MFNPAVNGDSLILSINSPRYEVPNQPYPFGGGGVFFSSPVYKSGPWGTPFILQDINKTIAGKHTIHIRKRKMGIVTQTIDTVKIYPYETKTIEINW
jgi:hypothetical protein